MQFPDPARLVSQCNRLRAERNAFERNWQEIADFMRPLRASHGAFRSQRERQTERICDSTALLAVENFAGGLYGMMTNPASRWFSLRLHDEDLNRHDPARDWLWDVESRLLNSFGPHASRFYAVLPALYADLACFGTAVFYSEEQPGLCRYNDNVRPLAECLIAENAAGDIDTVFRRFALTARQALEMFGTGLSPAARRMADTSPGAPVPLIHAVLPNPGQGDGMLDPAARPFLSAYVEEETCHLAGQGGYHEMPYQVPRWSQAAGEVWGRGIGDQVLPDVRMLNRMEETALRSAQKIADPPLAAADRGLVKAAHTAPGGITYGAIDGNGQVLVRPLYTGGTLGPAFEMMQQRRESIREAFHFSLMQFAGSPGMTATEWMGRHEEKLRLLGPNLGRLQGEFLSPLIRRRFGMLSRAGQLPPPPPEIAGQDIAIDYVSPLDRAQMAGEAQAVVRLYESIAEVARVAPNVLDNVDHDEAAQVLGRGWAVPARIMRDPRRVAAMRLVQVAGAI